jgi:hypothetical protein
MSKLNDYIIDNDISFNEQDITDEVDELNKEMLAFCRKHIGGHELQYRCAFDNGEWDYEAMARFIVGKIGCSYEFEQRIRMIHSRAFTDDYLINRGLY